ncbi:MAG: hypothetical protein ABSG51_18315 [Terracidiphilus sp.]|jgi:hypothetical protein
MSKQRISIAFAAMFCCVALFAGAYTSGREDASAGTAQLSTGSSADLLTYSNSELKVHAIQTLHSYVGGDSVEWENEDLGWRDQCDIGLMPDCEKSINPTKTETPDTLHLLHSIEVPPQQQQDREPAGSKVTIPRVLQSIYYNSSAAKTIQQFNLNDSQALMQRLGVLSSNYVGLSDQDIQDFAVDAVVVKTIWEVVAPVDNGDPPQFRNKPYARGAEFYTEAGAQILNQEIRSLFPVALWNQKEPNDPDAKPYIDLNQQDSCSARIETGRRVYALGCFYHRSARPQDLAALKLKPHELPDVVQNSCGTGTCEMILVGVHIMTREIPNWVWMTFYWSPHLLIDQTPSIVVQDKWTLFEANATINNTDPIANPYLEGPSTGMNSNCLECHRHAAFRTRSGSSSPAAAGGGSATQPILLPRYSSGIAGTDMGTRVGFALHDNQVQVQPPIPPQLRDLQFPQCYFDGALQTHFLWTIALRSDPNPASAGDPCPKP